MWRAGGADVSLLLRNLEEEGVDRVLYRAYAVELEQLVVCKVSIPQIFDVVRKVRLVWRVARRKDPVKVLVDGHHESVIAQVRATLGRRSVRGSAREDQVRPIRAVLGPLDVGFPAQAPGVARELLVK